MAENERLRERLGQVEPGIAELERLLEEVRRAAKRQSAPFSKGRSKDESRPPAARRATPMAATATGPRRSRPTGALDAPLPACCPHCGEGIDFERWAEQFQTELPEVRPVVTRLQVGVGRCRRCRRRV